MRSLLIVPVLFAAGMLVSFTGGNTFEGNLTITSGKTGTESKTVLAVKNDKIAINPGGTQQMVLNVKTGDFHTIVKQGSMQTLVKLNVGVLSALKEMPAFMGTFSNYLGATGKGKAEISATDEVKTISGYNCRKYIIKDEASTTTVWLTQDMPFSITPLLEQLKLSEGMTATMKSSFPMEGTVKDNKTGETTSFKVVAEKKPVEDKLFTFPPDLPMLDMTPVLQEMIQTNDPEDIKEMFNQFMPK